MGIWSFITPQGTTNYARNPSFEDNITDWWNNYATGAAAGNRIRNQDFQRFGASSIFMQKTGGAVGDRWGLNGLLSITSTLNQTYVASVWVNVRDGATAEIIMRKDGGVGAAQEATATIVGPTTDWVRLETTVLTANATGDPLRVFIYLRGAATATGSYWDAVQVEARATHTTYCDGDQDGCEWLGAEHLSNSSRSAVSRAGGTVIDFADREFQIGGHIGAGMTPITGNFDSYATLPGGERNSQKTNIRPFSLTGVIRGTSRANLHANRKQLIEDVAPNSVPGDQPVILRYTGATTTKEISAYYETGLEGRIRATLDCWEQNVALRFVATDPDFTEIGDAGDLLDSNDADANRRIVAGRLRSTGQWDTLGPPNALGTYNSMSDIVIGQDQVVYWGGNFQNFDNIAAADYIVSYDQQAAVWAAVGGGLNSLVFGLAVAPNGDIYACGQFLNAGAVANADYIAVWNGAAWAAVGNPNQGAAVITQISDMAFDSNGNLYVVGLFLNLANIAAADYVAMWDGAAWNAVGAPAAGAAIVEITDVAIDSQDNIYVGGNFTNLAGVATADHWAMWDGSAWTGLVALNALVRDVAIAQDDTVYITGDFTDAGGELDADYIASWNGVSISPLSTGLDALAFFLRFAPEGLLYVMGSFTTAGGVAVSGIALWNGASFAHLDFQHTGGSPFPITFGLPDPVVPTNYDIWLGFSATGGINYAGTANVVNAGTEEAFPQIIVSRVAGTSAILYSIRNETTGKVLLFAYSLLNGEVLTIDLRPTQKSIVSNFFGPRPDAVLPNCDFGEWSLQPGANQVTCFIDEAGVPTIEVRLIWEISYWSAD